MNLGLQFAKRRTAPKPSRSPRRRAAKEKEVLDILFRQGAIILCGCGCGTPLTRDNLARDHRHALELGGADEPENWLYIRQDPCHKLKTFGSKATSLNSDLHAVAKGKRLRGETKTGPKAKIKSPGFATNRNSKFKAKMGGGIVVREGKDALQ